MRKPTAGRRWLAAVPALSVVLGSLGAWPLPVAAAQTTPPATSHSWYIEHPDNGSMATLGANDGRLDDSTCTQSMVILDFGQIDNEQYVTGNYNYAGYGVDDFNSTLGYPFVEDDQVYLAALAYARAWWNATSSCPTLKLVLGVNNKHMCPNDPNTYGECDPTTAAREWGQMVNNVASSLGSKGYTPQITVWAGDDMEGGWDCYPSTLQFVNGFAANNPSKAELIDFGDAGQGTCRTAFYPDGSTQDGLWNDSDVYQVAWKAQIPNYPLPESYTAAHASEWGTIYNTYHPNNSYMWYRGAISTAGYDSPNQTWWNLWNPGQASQNGTLDELTFIAYQS